MRSIVGAELVSALGSRMTALAMPWFVLTTTGSPTRMGIVAAVELLPVALLGVLSAPVVQRLGVRRSMLLCDLACAVLTAALPLLHLLGLLSFPLLLVIAFAVGSFSTPYITCQRLVVPVAFEGEEVRQTQANSLITGATQLASLVGPLVAGALIALVGTLTLLWIDAVTFVLSAGLLWRGLPRDARPDVPSHPVGALAGARFVLRNPLVLRVSLVSLIAGTVFPALTTTFPVYARSVGTGGPEIAGVLLASFALGSLIGVVWVIRLAERLNTFQMTAIGGVLVALPLWGIALSPPWWCCAAMLMISGAFIAMMSSPLFTLIMSETPDDARAQTVAFLMTMNLLAAPLGCALAGPAIERIGVTGVVAIVAASMSFAAALLLTLPRIAREREIA
jgi:predicted MFS family arabinose efflux permease